MDAKNLLNVKRDAVESSNIKTVGYHEESKTLVLEFYSGGIYAYHPITRDGYVSLIKAESIGSHFHSHIKLNENIDCNKLNV